MLLRIQVELACRVGDARLFQGDRGPQTVAGTGAEQLYPIVHGHCSLSAHRQPVNTADEVSMMKIRRTDIQQQ
ncbi:hypothetical protein D3C87_1705260 [compost metagenome]